MPRSSTPDSNQAATDGTVSDASSISTTDPEAVTTTDAPISAPLGFARVQDPDAPDDLGANNTGRIGDAREYDDLTRTTTLRPTGGEGYAAGDTAPADVFADESGNLSSTRPEGRGENIVARGAVVTQAQADRIAAAGGL